MEIRGTSYKQVADMNFCGEDREVMSSLNTLWMQTIDTKRDDIIAYPEDVMVEDVYDIAPRMYIDKNDFFEYEAENGRKFLISNAIHAEDMEAFFEKYLGMDRELDESCHGSVACEMAS